MGGLSILTSTKYHFDRIVPLTALLKIKRNKRSYKGICWKTLQKVRNIHGINKLAAQLLISIDQGKMKDKGYVRPRLTQKGTWVPDIFGHYSSNS